MFHFFLLCCFPKFLIDGHYYSKRENTMDAQTAQGELFQGEKCCWALCPWAPWNYTCTIPLGCGTRRAVIDP